MHPEAGRALCMHTRFIYTHRTSCVVDATGAAALDREEPPGLIGAFRLTRVRGRVRQVGDVNLAPVTAAGRTSTGRAWRHRRRRVADRGGEFLEKSNQAKQWMWR